MDFKRVAIALVGGVILFAGGVGVGRFSQPTRVETRTEVVQKVREVRLVQVRRETETKIKRVVVVESRPDGSSTSTTHEETQTHENENSSETAKTDTATDSKSTYTRVNDAPRMTIFVSGGLTFPAGPNLFNNAQPSWGVGLHVRVLGPVVVGAEYHSFGYVGALAGVTF